MPGTIWFSVGASVLWHAALGWQLYRAPAAPFTPPGRDTFQVRMVALPPAVSELEPPKPLPPEPEPLPPEPPRPKPRSRPAMASKPAPVSTRAAEPVPEPERAAAPAAMLDDSGLAPTGGVIAAPGAPFGALVTTASPVRASRQRAAAARPPAALARLSDLSRRPRAPSLDAALRQNYPAEKRRRGIEGQAEVRLVIDPSGRVVQVAIVSESAAGFADACRKTVLGSRWSEPLDRDGNPVSTRLTYRCRFQIER
jgi:periplasmic protein TonB